MCLVGCGGAVPELVPSNDAHGQSYAVGDFALKEDGSLFLVDPSFGGRANPFRLEAVVQGRLVDVYDTAADGTERRWFRDFLVGETEITDGVSQRVSTDPVTQRVRFVLLSTNDPERSDDEFDRNLRDAAVSVRPVFAKEPGALPPYPLIPRNGALMLQFNDALDPASVQRETVRVLAGVPPSPFEARVLPDPNHGALVQIGDDIVFRPTRVLIDLAVDAAEAAVSTSPLAANPLGLPASSSSNVSNVHLRVPTRVDFPAGQFQVLSNVGGQRLVPGVTDFVDTLSGPNDLVRAMRSGGEAEVNRGYLADLEAPVIIGEQPLRVTFAEHASSAQSEFVIDVEFDSTPCALRPDVGHVISIPAGRFRVVARGDAPVLGRVAGVRVTPLDGSPGAAQELLGFGSLLAPFEPSEGHRAECFVRFVPPAAIPPTEGVSPDSQILVRFSEAIDPRSFTALGSWMVVRTDGEPKPEEVVVGRISPSSDLQTFVWRPSAPLAHEVGIGEEYELWTDEDALPITDLAGNGLQLGLGRIAFTLPSGLESTRSFNYALRFHSQDEDRNGDYDEAGSLLVSRPEVRGQFLYDTQDAVVRPRPVSRFTTVIDNRQPVVGRMSVFNTGLQTPLSPLGSRMLHVWRYVDMGFHFYDENLYNLDVEGLHWSPNGGSAVFDRFERFRIKLGHSHRFPDEFSDSPGNILYFSSGLKQSDWDKAGINSIDDPNGAMTVVHPKELGYTIDPNDMWTADTGNRFLPFPLNRDPDPTDDIAFTWRDTELIGVGAPFGGGVEPGILVNLGLLQFSEIGLPYPPNEVPSIGLPLLLEYSCYPSDSGRGLNAFQVSIATTALPKPFFRVFSTGGIDATGTVAKKDPELEPSPSGGFNPSNGFLPTPAGDPVFYWGAVDFVVRVSRVHTIWIDSESVSEWIDAVVEPSSGEQPEGTSIQLDFRGALDLMEFVPETSKDATTYDPYGNARPLAGWGSAANPVEYLVDAHTWTPNLDELSGARFVQVRATFVSNTLSGAEATLSGLGVAARALGD